MRTVFERELSISKHSMIVVSNTKDIRNSWCEVRRVRDMMRDMTTYIDGHLLFHSFVLVRHMQVEIILIQNFNWILL